MQLQELNRTITDANGNEIRIYKQYRFSIGNGERRFDGYLVDNGMDRLQVQAWWQVEDLVERMTRNP